MRKLIFLNISFLLLITLLFTSSVFAHPGRTAADGCHYCRTRCDYWGVPWNQKHCHGGGSVEGEQETQPAYIPPTNTPIPYPTWTPIPTRTPTPTNTPTPKPTRTPTPTKVTVKKPVKTKLKNQIKKKKVKKSFWQWLLGR